MGSGFYKNYSVSAQGLPGPTGAPGEPGKPGDQVRITYDIYFNYSFVL